jgi:Subtilase family
MKTPIRVPAVLCLPAVVICCWLPGVTVAAASTVAPLPASNYTVRPVCAAPAPGYAGCLALRLVPVTAAARAHTHPLGITRSRPIVAVKASEGAFGLRPQDLLGAYNLPLPPQPASTQTIAIVDAYNDLGAEADLEIYDEEFGLPPCTKASGCFAKVNQSGQTGNLPFPESEGLRAAKEAVCKTGIEPAAGEACKEVEEADGWTTEISLDIETAHAVCQNCKIMLIEAKSASFLDLEEGEKTAASLGATEISNSWGGPELGETQAEDQASSFNHPGIVITAAAGDNGYLDWSAKEGSLKGYADYPASSPHVVAVGGTRLNLTAGEVWKEETVWNGSGAGGGGCSTELIAPAWQQSASDWLSVGCGEHRAVADVSADADPYTGIAMYDSTAECEYEEGGQRLKGPWCTIGGTSLASPLVASVFALAGGSHGVEYPAQTLYENLAASPSSLHDVLTGSNGECLKPFEPNNGLSGCTPAEEAANSKCSAKLICLAGPGYDGPTGIGTPNGIAAFQPLTEEAKKNFEERKTKEKQAEEQKRKEKLEEEEKEEEARRKSPSEGTTGAPPPTAVTPPGPLASPGTTTSSSPGPPVQPTIRLSAFALTPNALIALRRVRPRTSSVGFVFTLSAAARVRATLAKRIGVRGHGQWKPLPGALTFAAIRGRNRQRLSSRNPLTPGRYRLTLIPQHGGARSITFQVR